METEMDFAVKMIVKAFEEANILCEVKIFEKSGITIKFLEWVTLRKNHLNPDGIEAAAAGKSNLSERSNGTVVDSSTYTCYVKLIKLCQNVETPVDENLEPYEDSMEESALSPEEDNVLELEEDKSMSEDVKVKGILSPEEDNVLDLEEDNLMPEDVKVKDLEFEDEVGLITVSEYVQPKDLDSKDAVSKDYNDIWYSENDIRLNYEAQTLEQKDMNASVLSEEPDLDALGVDIHAGSSSGTGQSDLDLCNKKNFIATRNSRKNISTALAS